MKIRIDVSPEMVAYVGSGQISTDRWPADSHALSYDLSAGTVSVFPTANDVGSQSDDEIILIVAASACVRIFDFALQAVGNWHLSSDIRAIALAVRDCALPLAARDTLRLAKSIELLCATFERLSSGALVPVDDARMLSAIDARRIVAAQRMIDDHWNEKLTLETISRACGINRAKLTRGFRAMFDSSIADAIAERRLGGARAMLLSTDLPVALVGYACGYQNNASFTRAFSRRFGLAPTQLRAAA